MAGGIRKKLHLHRFRPFRPGKESIQPEHSLIGGPGFSRVVYCNNTESQKVLTYGNNYVRSTKYTLASFFPKSLFEQFRRASNVYFLITAILTFTPLSPSSPVSTVLPLALVIVAAMVKEAIEDWRRKMQDIEVNNRKVKVHRGEGVFDNAKWLNLQVGDIVRVEKDEFFPADLILLSSSYEEAICYVETMNLDGETNLKLKQAVDATSKLHEDSGFQNFEAVIKSHDTKVMQNSTAPPSKRSKIERRMDKIVYLLFFILVLISFIGSIVFGISTREDLENGTMKRWYLRPDDTTIYYDPSRAPVAAILNFLTFLMLYSYFIPISLYITLEIVKDKTGTLTCNSMEFIKCSIAGTAYGRGVTEVERALSRREGLPSAKEVTNGEGQVENSTKAAIKGFNFFDERITHGNWVNEPHADVIRKFLLLLAICHSAVPEVDEETGRISYEAESPDEAAFVIAARELGFEFYERTQSSILLHELDPVSGWKVQRSYKLLNILEFSSSRKRMSVIVRNMEGKLLLLCKGADSVMFERLKKNGREFEEQTQEHINDYANAGLRTLVLAYRELDEEEYNKFNEEFTGAKNSVSADHEEMMEEVAEKIEKDLILLGATAVEDKLQNGVPECIDKLAQAGIKIWVLTGDKMETAINIGFACCLLRQGMKQIVISSETPKIKALEKVGDNSAVAVAFKANVLQQILEAKESLTTLRKSSEALALIIDGKSLSCALEDDVKGLFLELALGCASVICCRCSPKQKALVTRLVKIRTGRTTLAIGDGANDVGMLQEADIGIGISGVEGMQAVMSSDIAIAQFRYLERLLLVHGHWCYRRISIMICYFFYKNIALGFTVFFFEAYASFSGQTAYNDWYLTFYNIIFTSLPVAALGILEQDVSAELCLKFPLLYQEGVQNVLFSWFQFLGWAFNGVLNAILIFFFCSHAMEHPAFRKGGEVAELEILGTVMFTCIVWVVNCQIALSTNYFTIKNHRYIWGSIISWYIFLLAYGAMNPNISTTAYKVFIEACAPAPSYWLLTLFVVL
nr:putative phospholipid-transporting atpase 9 [Quercus suber]